MKEEIKCYGLHIRQSDFGKMLENNMLVDWFDKYDAAPVATSKNPMKYIASIVFKDEKTRDQALEALKDIGIYAVPEIEPAYVKKRYVKPPWLK